MKRSSPKKRRALGKTLKKMFGGMFRSSLRLTKHIGTEFGIDQAKRTTKKIINKLDKGSFEKKISAFTYKIPSTKHNTTKKKYNIDM